MPKIDAKYKTLGYDLSKRAFIEQPDPDNPQKTILVQKSPDEIYDEIKANCPDNLIIFIDEIMQEFPDTPLTKDFLAYRLWGGQPLGFKRVKYGNQYFEVPFWINSSRDRNIRDAVGELVQFLCRPIVASSHETGYMYCVNDTATYEKGVADLRQRLNTMGKRLAGLEKGGVIMRNNFQPTPISDNWELKQAKLKI